MANDKILLVTKDQDLFEYISVRTEAHLPFDVDSVESSAAAKAKLGLEKEIKVVITDMNISEGEGRELYEFFKQYERMGFIYVFAGESIEDATDFEAFFKDSKYNFVVLKSTVEQDFYPVAEELSIRLSTTSKDDFGPEEFDGKELCRVKTSYFLKFNKVDSDVFVKLPSGKFIRVIKGGNEISNELIENIQKKGENYLYQEQKDFEKLVTVIFSSLKQKMNSPQASKQEKINAQIQSIKQVQDTVRSMGISDDVIEFTDEIVASVQDVMKSSSNLSKLIKSMLKSKSAFFVRSSVLNYVLGGIVREIGWDSVNTLKKLVYASVFCDFGFTEAHAELASIIGEKDPRWSTLKKTQIGIIRAHPSAGAHALERSRLFLADELTIINQHHEKPDGSGFPRGLNYNTIPPLSAAFILAYDFTQIMVLQTQTTNDVVEPNAVLKFLGEDYAKANFNKPYIALKKALRI